MSNNVYKIMYYLICIGKPNFEVKIEILLHNLNEIFLNINLNFDIIINCYDNSLHQKIKDELSSLSYIKNIYIFTKKGVLTEVFLNNPYNIQLINYDYIFFILDDLKISKLNFFDAINIKKEYNIEFLSPKIINSTHDYMNKYSDLTINNFLEVYFLILTPKDIYKLFSIYNRENKWMWGTDLLFGYFNIKTGVYYNSVAIHSLDRDKNVSVKYAMKLAINEIKKYNFKDFKEIELKFNPIIKKIKF